MSPFLSRGRVNVAVMELPGGERTSSWCFHSARWHFSTMTLALSLQTDRRHCCLSWLFNESHLRGAGPGPETRCHVHQISHLSAFFSEKLTSPPTIPVFICADKCKHTFMALYCGVKLDRSLPLYSSSTRSCPAGGDVWFREEPRFYDSRIQSPSKQDGVRQWGRSLI